MRFQRFTQSLEVASSKQVSFGESASTAAGDGTGVDTREQQHLGTLALLLRRELLLHHPASGDSVGRICCPRSQKRLAHNKAYSPSVACAECRRYILNYWLVNVTACPAFEASVGPCPGFVDQGTQTIQANTILSRRTHRQLLLRYGSWRRWSTDHPGQAGWSH